MNRVVTDRGMLSGGQIVRGAGGVDLSYDAAGQRRSARSDKASHALTGVVEQAIKPLYQDDDDMFSAQARAQNNARHPFLLDPNHVSGNAEKRGLLATAVVGLVGARGGGRAWGCWGC